MATITEELFDQAVLLTIGEHRTTPELLRTELGVSLFQSWTLMNALKRENIIDAQGYSLATLDDMPDDLPEDGEPDASGEDAGDVEVFEGSDDIDDTDEASDEEDQEEWKDDDPDADEYDSDHPAPRASLLSRSLRWCWDQVSVYTVSFLIWLGSVYVRVLRWSVKSLWGWLLWVLVLRGVWPALKEDPRPYWIGMGIIIAVWVVCALVIHGRLTAVTSRSAPAGGAWRRKRRKARSSSMRIPRWVSTGRRPKKPKKRPKKSSHSVSTRRTKSGTSVTQRMRNGKTTTTVTSGPRGSRVTVNHKRSSGGSHSVVYTHPKPKKPRKR